MNSQKNSARLHRAICLQQLARRLRLPNRELVKCFRAASLSPGEEDFAGGESDWQSFFRPLKTGHKDLSGVVDRLVADLLAAGRVRGTADSSLSAIDVVFPGEFFYPEAFYRLASPPVCLYIKGERSLLQEINKVSIVGTRAPSPYGERLCRRLVREWAGWGITIVSGLASGIDGMAHRYALAEKGKTIGILGCGPNRIYPPEHADLYAKMSSNGLLMTEFPPGTPPLRQNFPARNRLIAALGCCLLVIEAAKRSGTMITTDLALDLGIPVLCLPGAVDAPQSKGTNALIQQGACPLLSADDLLPYLEADALLPVRAPECRRRVGRECEGMNRPDQDGPDREGGLRPGASGLTEWAELLASGPLTETELATKMKLDIRGFLLAVGRAELAGEVIKKDGLYHLNKSFLK